MNTIDQAHAPAEDDPKLVYAIGLITVRYAMLEALLRDLIGWVLNTKRKQSEALTTHLNMRTMFDIAGSLVHESSVLSVQRDYILKVINRAEMASNRRNVFIHRLIGYANDQGEGLFSHAVTARGGPVKMQRTNVDSSKADQIASELGAVNLELVRIVIGGRPWDKTDKAP